MNPITDLNVVAEHLITEGDVKALAKCMEYSLQPEKVLQYIYDSKRYECLPPLLPFLSSLFLKDKRHELGIAILLDLLSRGEAAYAPKNLDLNFFLEQAVKRKVLVKFKNTIFNPTHYYELILQEDCLELFIALREKILERIDNYDFYYILVKYASVQIFETLQVSVVGFGICFHPLLSKYTVCVSNSFPEAEIYERMVRHMLRDASLREEVHRVSYGLEEQNEVGELIALLRLGYQISAGQKKAIQIHNPELYAKLFGEDV